MFKSNRKLIKEKEDLIKENKHLKLLLDEVKITEKSKTLIEKANQLEGKIDKAKKWIRFFKYIPWIFVGIGVLSSIIITKYLLFCSSNYSISDVGSIFSGIVGTLFTLTGLLFVYLAFLKQNEQALQQELEINLTQKALVSQQQEMSEQNKTITLQRFESTYLQLLDFFKNQLNILKETHKDFPYFNYLNEVFILTSGKGDHINKFVTLPLNLIDGEDFTIGLNKFFKFNENPMRLFIGNFILILNYIDKNLEKIENIDKSIYFKLLINILTPNDLKVLYYYGFIKEGEQFKNLVIRYSIFKDINLELLDNSHYAYYSSEN